MMLLIVANLLMLPVLSAELAAVTVLACAVATMVLPVVEVLA